MDSARTQTDSLTPSQWQAVAARGNVLVMAGAGTGKTHTLVERCLHCLCEEQPPASLEEILVGTFTEAAAAEMRRRLREQLEERLRAAPDETRWTEQIALFDTAHIGTLHGFCLKLVREHFHELGLDPQLAVLDAGEARLLADETLDEELQEHYAGQDELAEAVQSLIQIYGGGRGEGDHEDFLERSGRLFLAQAMQAALDERVGFARARAGHDQHVATRGDRATLRRGQGVGISDCG